MPEFYLRLRDPADSRRAWIRKDLFTLLWHKHWLFELATNFESKEAAVGFAREYHIDKDVELVTLDVEAVDAA